MTIIHLVTALDSIHFGIWNAAVFGSVYLEEQYKVTSQLWVTDPKNGKEHTPSIPTTFLNPGNSTPASFVSHLLVMHPDKESTLVVSHGCWRLPTRFGYAAKKQGYKWIYVPHGMLEPWSMQQHKWKKLLYFHLFEKSMGLKAEVIRAVGTQEHKNLRRTFKKPVVVIENGVKVMDNVPEKSSSETIFLFMARLHMKKGIVPLVKAWHDSLLNHPDKKLIIAGPDEGELQAVKDYLGSNVKYVGAVYGEAKITLLKNAHFYILPSLSEGFPTSVLEAMSYGAIPVISQGCNFPQVFENKLGYEVKSQSEDISAVLQKIACKKFDTHLSTRNHSFIKENYSEEIIGQQQFHLYHDILSNKKYSS